jgi:hypothetical protein
MTKLSDTDEKIEKIQIALIRKLSTSERVSRLRSLSRTVINLSRRAIRRANPELSERELNFKFIMYHYGNEIAEKYNNYISRKLL